MKLILKTLSIGALFATSANAGTYHFKVTNGSSMPISPGVVYTIIGQEGVTEIGQVASEGLIQLCQTGSTALLMEELKANPNVKSVSEVAGPVFPGKSSDVKVEARAPHYESIHYLAMYGKTKDLCASINISNANLIGLEPESYSEIRHHIMREMNGNDQIISTGAFSQPIVTDSACDSESDAISCVRSLSDRQDGGVIKFFNGYLPGLLSLLESKFGSEETQDLLLNSGSVFFRLQKN